MQEQASDIAYDWIVRHLGMFVFAGQEKFPKSQSRGHRVTDVGIKANNLDKMILLRT